MENEFEIITGCMMAGKSKYLIDNYFDKDIEAYKPTIDTRNKNFIVSRAYKDKKIPCQQVSTLSDIDLTKNIIIVDEFQFFDTQELKDFIFKCKKEHRKLVMVGLDLLADGNEWSSYTAIKPLADKITKLQAICSVCNKPASFTARISKSNEAIQIEGEGVRYEPRCEEHFR